MKIVATKRAHPTIERLGYLQAVLIENESGWDLADEKNLPTRAEVFVHAKFDEGVNKKFRQNELIICDANELENWETGDCMYGAVGTKCTSLTMHDDIYVVLDLDGRLENQEHYNIKSNIRPSTFSFFKTTTDEDEEIIVGPMSIISSTFNESENLWESRMGIYGKATRNFPDLKAYCVYIIPISGLPNDTLKTGKQFHSNGKCIATGLAAFIKSAPIEQRAIMSDGTLIKILDDSLNKNSKLGRKGRRDAISQIEASKSLNETMKPALLSLFERMDEHEEDHKRVILEVLKKNKIDINLLQNTDDGYSSGLNEKLTQLQQELETSNERRKKAEGELKVLSKNQSFETNANVEKLKEEYEEKLQTLEKEKENLNLLDKKEKEISALELQKSVMESKVNALNETELGLTETVARLKSELALTTSQFREKALSVLPFLEIMNNVKSPVYEKTKLQPEIPAEMFVPATLPELIMELSRRVTKQGYQAEADWLNLVSTLYLSNKFIGFFGSPGTGKTTIANCFNNALGIEKINCDRVKVGRGWSSFVDFVGYDNSFTGSFKYKDRFYEKFENSTLDKKVFYSIIFDEATLSEPEFYLSNFTTEADLTHNDDYESINLDGHNINLPMDTRFVLTFNVDETTVQLSDRFLSRMPIVHLINDVDIDGLEDVKYSKFDFIDKSQSDKLIQESLDQIEKTEDLRQEFDTRLQYWNKIMPEKLGTRKNKQIEKFFNLASNLNDIDPTVVVDFVEEVFLLPYVKGDGIEYKLLLEETIPKISSAKVRQRLSQIKSLGQKYNIFRHC
jgi:hypothetical protein